MLQKINPCLRMLQKINPGLHGPGLHIIKCNNQRGPLDGRHSLLKLQAGLLAHGSSLVSTFPDVPIQWFLETAPHLQRPHRSGFVYLIPYSPRLSAGAPGAILHI